MPYPVEKFGGIVYLQNIAKSAIIYPELLSGTEMPERFGKSGSLRARAYTQGGNGVDGTDMVWEVGCFENLVVAGRIFFFAWDFRVKNARDCMTDGMRAAKRDPSGQILLS